MAVDALRRYRVGPLPEAAYGVATEAPRDAIADEAGVLATGGLYTSRIIKAGALLADTLTLLDNWDESQSVADNLGRLQSQNIFGKGSRSRIRDILGIFRQRYLRDKSVTAALACLVKNQFPKPSLDRVLYYHAAVADKLLHDTVTNVLLERYSRGFVEISVEEIEMELAEWVRKGKTASCWSQYTILRVARGLLATLRDFGVLRGASRKRIAPMGLPVAAFSYIAFDMHRKQPSGDRLVQSNEWSLFFLSPDEVERALFEAHQRHLLEYHAAGTVTRLTFPASSLEEYAHVLVKGTH